MRLCIAYTRNLQQVLLKLVLQHLVYALAVVPTAGDFFEDGSELALSIVLHPELDLAPRETCLTSEHCESFAPRVGIVDIGEHPLLQDNRHVGIERFTAVVVGVGSFALVTVQRGILVIDGATILVFVLRSEMILHQARQKYFCAVVTGGGVWDAKRRN